MYIDETSAKNKRYSNWIDILLDTPVPDGRHRLIEHVLAPYLINMRNLELGKAKQIVEEWVERCETYGPARGNINAFVERACSNTQKFKRKPKDLSWFKNNHRKVYAMISSIAEGYGIDLEAE